MKRMSVFQRISTGLILCVAVLAGILLPAQVRAAEAPVVTVTADKTEAHRGDEITVTVSVTETTLTAAAYSPVYAPTMYELVSGSMGAMWSDAVLAEFSANVGELDGNYFYDGFVAAFSEPKTVSGELFSFTLKVLDASAFRSVDLTDLVVLKNDAIDLSPTLQDARITVSCVHSYGAWMGDAQNVQSRACSVCGNVESEALGVPQVQVSADKTVVHRGDEITVTVSVTDVWTSAIAYVPSYNPCVELVSGQAGAAVSGALMKDFSLNVSETTEGYVYDGFVAAYGEPKRISGELCSFTLKVREDAPFESVKITDFLGIKNVTEDMQYVLQDASVTVECVHSYGQWFAQDGENHARECIYCGDTIMEEHGWSSSVSKEPTCVDTGVTLFSCSTCDATREEPIAATGNHVYGEWKDYSDDYHVHNCTTCGKPVLQRHTFVRGYCAPCGKYEQYTVVFQNEDGTQLSSMNYHYGDPVVAPAAPSKEADKTYTYTFAGWDKNVTACQGDALYTATYQATYIDYTVIFKNTDGTVLSRRTYHYGDAVEEPAAPSKAADKIYTYAFSGWDLPVTNCQGSVIYTATYKATYIDYTVIFKNADGTVLSEKTYHYGDAVEAPEAPTKAADKTYTYSFAAWSEEVSECTGDMVYTAVYDAVYINYTVTFKDWDGRVLSKATYHYGDTVTEPATPTKPSDGMYFYAFVAWTPEVTPVTADAEYMAVYEKALGTYTVVFKDWNGTVLSSTEYHYGDPVEAPAAPSRAADKTYTYAFAGWDKNVTSCAGNATYTALYEATYIDYTVTFQDEDGTVLSEKTYHYGEKVEAPAAPAKAADKTYTYTFAGWGAEVTTCAGNTTYTAVYDADYIDYTVIFLAEDGTPLSQKTYHYGNAVEAPEAPAKAADKTFTYTFAGWGQVVTNCQGNATYQATYEAAYIDYTVVFKNADGTVISEKIYHYGEDVEAPAAPTKAADKTYTYTFVGWDQVVTNCQGDVTYTALYKETYIDYTVTFQDEDGTVLSEKTYHYGDDVEVPEAPSKAADKTYTYTFAGWGAEVTTCAGNTTYTAVYDADYIDYTVTFLAEDGTVLSEKTYHYGDAVEAPEAPAKAADKTFTYTFAGWDKALTNCQGNATYQATYEAAYIDYTVVFKNADGTVLSEKTYHYGEDVEAPEAPAKAADKTYTYAFAGWDKNVTACQEDAIYTATYEATYIDYTVIFLAEDGTVLSEKTYHYGEDVEAPEAPAKAADKTFTYTFIGWGAEVSACEGNTTYQATYEASYIEYTVVFRMEDGTVIQERTYHYEDAVEVPADPAAPQNYRFVGWDKEITKCLGDAVYTAVFEQTVLPGDFDSDGDVDDMDAIYLLRNTLLPNRYPIQQAGDVNGDGIKNDADALYLLRHTMLPNRYPLYPAKKEQ